MDNLLVERVRRATGSDDGLKDAEDGRWDRLDARGDDFREKEEGGDGDLGLDDGAGGSGGEVVGGLDDPVDQLTGVAFVLNAGARVNMALSGERCARDEP